MFPWVAVQNIICQSRVVTKRIRNPSKQVLWKQGNFRIVKCTYFLTILMFLINVRHVSSDFFLPTCPYQEQHIYQILRNLISYLYLYHSPYPPMLCKRYLSMKIVLHNYKKWLSIYLKNSWCPRILQKSPNHDVVVLSLIPIASFSVLANISSPHPICGGALVMLMP